MFIGDNHAEITPEHFEEDGRLHRGRGVHRERRVLRNGPAAREILEPDAEARPAAIRDRVEGALQAQHHRQQPVCERLVGGSSSSPKFVVRAQRGAFVLKRRAPRASDAERIGFAHAFIAASARASSTIWSPEHTLVEHDTAASKGRRGSTNTSVTTLPK